MSWEAMGFDQNVSKSIKWDVMPWMKTPKYAMTENYDRTFVISKTAKDPEASFLALKALCERAAGNVFAKYHFGLPYFKASAEDPGGQRCERLRRPTRTSGARRMTTSMGTRSMYLPRVARSAKSGKTPSRLTSSTRRCRGRSRRAISSTRRARR